MDLNNLLAGMKKPEASQSEAYDQSSNPFAITQNSQTKPSGYQTNTAGNKPFLHSTNTDTPNADRKTNLLNLLKFNNSSTVQSGPAPGEPIGHSYNSPPAQIGVTHQAERPSSGTDAVNKASENPQEQLLKLLNRGLSKTASLDLNTTNNNHQEENAKPKQETSPAHIFGSKDGRGTSPFAPNTTKAPLFTYVNPFEQFATASPTNKTPLADSNADPIEPKFEFSSMNGNGNVSLNPSNVGAIAQPKPLTPSPLPDGRTHIEALIGIGAKKLKMDSDAETQRENMSNPIHNDKNSKNLPKKDKTVSLPKVDADSTANDAEELEKAVKKLAAEIKQEFEDKDTKAIVDATIPAPVVAAIKDTVDDLAQEAVADSWESADTTKDDDAVPVHVYNLPMRPFNTLNVDASKMKQSVVRQDMMIKVASVKKAFDQVDRTLVTATTNFIIYALPKSGGFRVIRQDDAKNTRAFLNKDNQIFNISANAPLIKPSKEQFEAVLATGINGSIYWTQITSPQANTLEDDLDQHGFILPPLSSQDDNVSTSQLKTRAKQSSRHPEVFAVGRGKYIHLVWPNLAMSPQYLNSSTRVVDTEKFFSDKTVRIATGKAGKDFAFSADDSVIVTLDKAGKIKFWDIDSEVKTRESVDAALVPAPGPAVEIKKPLMILQAFSDKSWPTSVIFLDKERPCTKGVALRYLLVGMKQNHTLQLWDLGLGKAVQELNFPHQNETDPICSIAYHAKSSIITVGHPSRNSIFFIHLSAPRYNLPHNLSQSEYLRRLEAKDTKLPGPESTAIMSGIREISLDSIGQLRSLDVMQPGQKDDNDNDDTVFEVYVMHSKGVTYLNVKPQDLGWDKDGKVLFAHDAEREQIVEVSPLREIAGPLREAPGDDPLAQISLVKAVEATPTIETQRPTNGTATTEEKKRKKKNAAVSDEANIAPTTPDIRKADKPVSYAHAARVSDELSKKVVSKQSLTTPMREKSAILDIASHTELTIPDKPVGTSNQIAEQSRTFTEAVTVLLEDLYRKLDEDKRVQEAAGAAKQDAVLRLVSSTLTDNVEKSLSRIIETNIQQSVLPAITNIVAAAIDRNVASEVSRQLNIVMPREFQKTLPSSMSQVMREASVLRSITDHVTKNVASHVEADLNRILQLHLTTTFKNLADTSAKQVASNVDQQITTLVGNYEARHSENTAKIENLTAVTHTLLKAIQEVNENQSVIQNQLEKMQQTLPQQQASRNVDVNSENTAVESAEIQNDETLDSIVRLLRGDQLEHATIMWLQSQRHDELFDKVFHRLDPRYLQSLEQVVILSVATATSASFESHIAERLTWLEISLASVKAEDGDILEHAPRILEIIVSRLQDLYLQIAENSPGHSLLPRIHALVRRSKELGKRVGS